MTKVKNIIFLTIFFTSCDSNKNQSISPEEQNLQEINLCLITGNSIFLDSTSNFSILKSLPYYDENSGIYTAYSKVDHQLLDNEIKKMRNSGLYIYDTSLKMSKTDLDEILFSKTITPHFGTVEEWISNNTPASEISNQIINYASQGYLIARLKKNKTYFLASDSPLNLVSVKNSSTKISNNEMINWISKQKETTEFQKEYQKYKSGNWWNDRKTKFENSLYDLPNGIKFGVTKLIYDGSDLSEDNPYFGESITYIYSFDDGHLRNGIEVNNYGSLEFIRSFYDQESHVPYVILEDQLTGSILLFGEIENKWKLLSQVEIGYFDCPF